MGKKKLHYSFRKNSSDRSADSLATKLCLVVSALEAQLRGFTSLAKLSLADRHYQAEFGNELKTKWQAVKRVMAFKSRNPGLMPHW
jgi:hypothetical protein